MRLEAPPIRGTARTLLEEESPLNVVDPFLVPTPVLAGEGLKKVVEHVAEAEADTQFFEGAIQLLLHNQAIDRSDFDRLTQFGAFTQFQRTVHDNAEYFDPTSYATIYLSLFQQAWNYSDLDNKDHMALLDNIRECVQDSPKSRSDMFTFAKEHLETKFSRPGLYIA